MSKLQTEWRRLYLPHTLDKQHADLKTARLVDDQAQVRAMVLELARPADWEALSGVWRGVQLDLALPAPGIAVSGLDGYQLWFSLAEPVQATRACAFLDALRARYLAGVARDRIGMLPMLDASNPPQIRHASLVPSQQTLAEHWSAFVAPDLAPVFAETPWLDFPPSEHGQAELLAQLDCIAPAAFQHAEALLTPARQLDTAATKSAQHEHAGTSTEQALDPKRFLLKVMNDDNEPMALRIEAAKALLPFCEDRSRA